MSCISHRYWEHGRLTLARKLDAVHNITVTRSSVIPSVRRARPSKDGFTSMRDPDTLFWRLGEDEDLLEPPTRAYSLSNLGRTVPSADAGGTGATAALISIDYEGSQEADESRVAPADVG